MDPLMFLLKLAWQSRFRLPLLITLGFMILDIRMQLEINIQTRTVRRPEYGGMLPPPSDDDDDDLSEWEVESTSSGPGSEDEGEDADDDLKKKKKQGTESNQVTEESNQVTEETDQGGEGKGIEHNNQEELVGQ